MTPEREGPGGDQGVDAAGVQPLSTKIIPHGGIRRKGGRSWRWRECSECSLVAAASEFETVGTFRPGWQSGEINRRCPECGFKAPTWRFQVVRERHAP